MSELPKGWSYSDIGTVADVKLGKMLDKAKNKGEPSPYLRNINVRWGSFDLTDLTEMRMTPDERFAFSISDGDVLVCEGGEPGRAAVWRNGPTSLTYQKALMRLRPEGGVEADFLQTYLRFSASSGTLQAYFTGTTIKHLPQGALRQISLPLPPLAEQRRIVEKLDALTARTARARADLDRIPALAARYKQAVLAKAFSGELTADWRAKHSNLAADWSLKTIGDIAKDIRYGTAAKCTYAPSETPVLRIPNVANGRIDLNDLKHASFTEKERLKLSLEAGDLLVIRSNGSLSLVGRAAVVSDDATGYLYAGYLIRIRLDRAQIDPVFLQMAFEEPNIRGLIERFAKSTSGVNNINSEQLKSLTIPLPIAAEQREIVLRVQSAFADIDRMVTEAAAARRLLDRLDQSVLAKAFRGELVPQDPSDEPASILLDRIRAERAAAPKAKRGRRKAAA